MIKEVNLSYVYIAFQRDAGDKLKLRKTPIGRSDQITSLSFDQQYFSSCFVDALDKMLKLDREIDWIEIDKSLSKIVFVHSPKGDARVEVKTNFFWEDIYGDGSREFYTELLHFPEAFFEAAGGKIGGCAVQWKEVRGRIADKAKAMREAMAAKRASRQ